MLHILDVQTGKDLTETADRMDLDGAVLASRRPLVLLHARTELAPGMPATEKSRTNASICTRSAVRSTTIPPSRPRRHRRNDPVTPTELTVIVTASDSRYAVAFVSPGTDPRLRVYAAPVDAVHDARTDWRAVAPVTPTNTPAASTPVCRHRLTGDTLYWLSLRNAPRGEILEARSVAR